MWQSYFLPEWEEIFPRFLAFPPVRQQHTKPLPRRVQKDIGSRQKQEHRVDGETCHDTEDETDQQMQTAE